MYDFSETNMDENLEKEIKKKLGKDNKDDLEDVLENYKGLNFVHIWSKNKELDKYEFHIATLKLSAGASYFSHFCEENEENKYDLKINQVWELRQEIIKHPYEDRVLNKSEIQKIYNSMEEDFIDYQ